MKLPFYQIVFVIVQAIFLSDLHYFLILAR